MISWCLPVIICVLSTLLLLLSLRMIWVCFWNVVSFKYPLSLSFLPGCWFFCFVPQFGQAAPTFSFKCCLSKCSAPQCPSEAQSQCSGRPPNWRTPHHLCSRRNLLLWDALCLRGHQGSKVLRGHHRWALIQDCIDYGLNRLFSGHITSASWYQHQ